MTFCTTHVECNIALPVLERRKIRKPNMHPKLADRIRCWGHLKHLPWALSTLVTPLDMSHDSYCYLELVTVDVALVPYYRNVALNASYPHCDL